MLGAAGWRSQSIAPAVGSFMRQLAAPALINALEIYACAAPAPLAADRAALPPFARGTKSSHGQLISENIESGRPMVGTFLRHGSNIWLALGLAALVGCFLAGVLPFSLLFAVIGAL